MEIVKPFAVIVHDEMYLVARDTNETFFKNVGGRLIEGETDTDCLRRTLKSDINYDLVSEPELLFELPPTPAYGDPGSTVRLKGYKVEDIANPLPAGNVQEVAWVNSKNQGAYTLAPQITDLIIPKLQEIGLIR